MRIADLNTGSARLRDALDVLAAKWVDTKDLWKDANSRNVEENHLKPIADETLTTLGAIQHLGDVLMQAQRDCESWE